jgi:DNA-binding transcriptional MerR regulator
MKSYQTSQIAKCIGVHPNTIRLYEEIGFISKVERLPNGYRVFTDLHLYQLKIVRAALTVEIVHNGLRKKTIQMIKETANQNFDVAIALAKEYIVQVAIEIKNAEEAIVIVNNILAGQQELGNRTWKRREASDYLHISMDTLRNWELNGLLHIKRKENGYRIYSEVDMQRLKVIDALRCANYSLAAILRMLSALSKDPKIDIKEVIDTPERDESIISVCDKLLTSLAIANTNAGYVLDTLIYMKENF